MVVTRDPDAGPRLPVKVEPQDFHDTAQRFVDSQNDLERIREDLINGIGAAAGAAGACDGAHQYEDSWNAAMSKIINGGFHTAFDLLGAIGKGIDVSALNHWTADHDSVPGKAGSPPPWSTVTPHLRPCDTVVANLTGDSPWWMPGFLEKYIPTADSGKLDAAAEACRRAAVAIRGLTSGLHSKLQGLVTTNSSADLDQLEQFWQHAAGQQSILTGLPQALDDVADSLVNFRIWNDDTQQAIKDKIADVIDSLAIVGLVLVIGSVLTDGALDVIIAAVIEALELFGVDAAGVLVAPIAEVATAAATALVISGGAVAIAKSIEPALQASMSSTPNPNVEGVNTTKISNELGEPARPPAPKPGATSGRYSGELQKVPKPDPDADKLAERIGGESRVKFSNDPNGREWDVVSDEYLGQAKPDLKLGSDFRNQAKATFEAAKEIGRKVYYHFDGQPDPQVLQKLEEYSKRYGVPVIIDTIPFS
jgi:hypothetical protein